MLELGVGVRLISGLGQDQTWVRVGDFRVLGNLEHVKINGVIYSSYYLFKYKHAVECQIR